MTSINVATKNQYKTQVLQERFARVLHGVINGHFEK